MSGASSGGWEPQGLGKNWRAMFDQPRRDIPQDGAAASAPAPHGPEAESEGAHDLTEYRPWILQRARSHPAMMLEMRRYQPQAGIWTGWALAYPGLYGLEYFGDRMLSLDFGARQFVIEGRGLDLLARYIQQGTVLGIVEHNAQLWPSPEAEAIVTAIRRVEANGS